MLHKLKVKLQQTKLLLLYRRLLRYYFLITKKKSKSFIQLANSTYLNRHPDLFEFAQKTLGKNSNLNILSFGCSTGEECVSLSDYFPKSKIYGVDINEDNIATANTKNSRENIKYYHLDILSETHNLETVSFDAIFAFSVLCLEPEAKFLNNIKSRFSFETYLKFIGSIEKLVKPGGLLIIRSSNYRFDDTPFFKNYTPIHGGLTKFPLFDINSEKLPGEQAVNWVFKKNLSKK